MGGECRNYEGLARLKEMGGEERTCGARASGARLRLEPASMPSRRGYFLLLRQKKVTKEKALWWVDAARLDCVRI